MSNAVFIFKAYIRLKIVNGCLIRDLFDVVGLLRPHPFAAAKTYHATSLAFHIAVKTFSMQDFYITEQSHLIRSVCVCKP